MSHNWPSLSFPFQTMPPAPPAPASWVDDFLDFSSARRSVHRRTASDPIAFVEEGNQSHADGGVGFERLDDEQLRSMFSDEVAAAMGPSTSSDRNSEDDEKKVEWVKSEPGEVDSSSPAADTPAPADYKYSDNGCSHTIVDPKRIKRILANRQSAQRSRVRKLQYISELERSVTNLQNEVSSLSPRVAFFDHQRLLLNVDNSALKQRIAALAQDKIFKDAHEEALRKEVERLRRVYHDQNIKKLGDSAAGDSPSTADKRGCTADDE